MHCCSLCSFFLRLTMWPLVAEVLFLWPPCKSWLVHCYWPHGLFHLEAVLIEMEVRLCHHPTTPAMGFQTGTSLPWAAVELYAQSRKVTPEGPALQPVKVGQNQKRTFSKCFLISGILMHINDNDNDDEECETCPASNKPSLVLPADESWLIVKSSRSELWLLCQSCQYVF